MPHAFYLARLDDVTFTSSNELGEMYKSSPFVWQEDDRFELLLRLVNYSENPSEKVARIHHGSSGDGLRFWIDETPAIQPGPDVPDSYDSGGCEDPTLARVDGVYYVYYSGWNEHLKRGELLLATGTKISSLQKKGIALKSTEKAANPKEATIVRAPDGSWRLFLEYACENRSKIGVARSAEVAGPWEVLTFFFVSSAPGLGLVAPQHRTNFWIRTASCLSCSTTVRRRAPNGGSAGSCSTRTTRASWPGRNNLSYCQIPAAKQGTRISRSLRQARDWW